MSDNEGFKFQGTGKLDRIERFTTKNNKTILTLIFHKDGQYPQWTPIKVFGRLAEMASEWKPGDILEVTGELGGRDWNGKVYGDATARTVEVVAQWGKRGDEKSGSGSQQSFADGAPVDDQDVPF